MSAAGGSVTLTLTEDTAATNGLFTVSYDPQVLTYAGLSSLIGSRAVHVDEEQGLVTFAYAAVANGQKDIALFHLEGMPENREFNVVYLKGTHVQRLVRDVLGAAP